MKRLIIIPTYNENQNIAGLIDEIRALSADFDVLVVDDNSPDGTAVTVEGLIKKTFGIHLLKRGSKQGLGTAYREGFKWAVTRGYDRLFTMDADFSHQPKYLSHIDDLLGKNELAIGSRYIRDGGVEGWPLRRKLLSSIGNLYARLMTGLPVRDCTGGYVGIRREVVEYLLGENIHSEGYSFQIELKYLAWKQGYSLAEYPIIFVDRKCGKSKISRSIIAEALLLAWKLRFGKRLKSPGCIPAIANQITGDVVPARAGTPRIIEEVVGAGLPARIRSLFYDFLKLYNRSTCSRRYNGQLKLPLRNHDNSGDAPRPPRGNAVFKILDRYLGIPLLWLAGLLGNNRESLRGDMKSILVIKLSAMGDTVLLIPALRALRNKYPNAEITALGTAINDEIFRACPYVNKVITLDIKKFLFHPFKQISMLRNSKYDVALDFDQWLRLSPLLAVASGARVRIGFRTARQGRHYAYTQSIEHQKNRHEIQCFLDILAPLSIADADEQLEFWVKPEILEKSKKILESAGIRVAERFGCIPAIANQITVDVVPARAGTPRIIEEVVGAGLPARIRNGQLKLPLRNHDKSGDAPERFIIFHPETPAHGGQRQWPEAKYVELGKIVGERHRLKIVVTGTKQDAAVRSRIASALHPFGVMLPAVSLPEFAGVLQQSSLLVCGNTGIMHLACALGVPVVALHGPTNPVKWGPRGKNCVTIKSKLECSPCLYLGFEYGCGTNRCMETIETGEVSAAIEKIVAYFSPK